LVIAMMTVCSFSIHACDICGCGVSNYYIGILPQFNHKFFGFRYHFSSYNTRLANDPTQFSKDFYQTIEWWGGWNIGKRFQVLALVPYNFNHQNSDEGITSKQGLGDIIVIGNYKVFDIRSVSGNNKSVSQQLWLGGGLKLPTGKFQVDPSNPDIAAIANGQLGSGSTDVILNAMYNVHVNRLGMNTTAGYKISSVNKDGYKFGDKLSASSFVYYTFRASKVMISPNLGALYQNTKPSELKGSKVDLTGGTILRGSLGAEISYKKVAVGFNMQMPITQNFAEGQTKEKFQGMVHITFAI
ncbi:MAG TPA: transporter, partial [Chitinophagaceae bacterium]